MLYSAHLTAQRTCEEGEAIVCYDLNDQTFHIEANAQLSIEVTHEAYGQALVALWDEVHPEFRGALSYNVGTQTSSDIRYLSLSQTLFTLNQWYLLSYEEQFYLSDKIAQEINDTNIRFIPMDGDGFAFLTNLDQLSQYQISLDDINQDGLVDAVDQFDKLQSLFIDKEVNAQIFNLSLNEPFVFYPFLTAYGWQIFEDKNAYFPGFESDRFLNSLEFISTLADYPWNGTEALEASAYDWNYVSAMEQNNFIFSMASSWMFVDDLETKIDGNWQVSHFPKSGVEQEVLSPLLTNVYGYVVSKDVVYPSMAHEVLRLIRSQNGLQTLLDTTDFIPLVEPNYLNSLQLIGGTSLEFAKALSYGQTESLISFQNDPTLSAFSIYYSIDFMPIIQSLWNKEISAKEAQIKICTLADAWLYQHEKVNAYDLP